MFCAFVVQCALPGLIFIRFTASWSVKLLRIKKYKYLYLYAPPLSDYEITRIPRTGLSTGKPEVEQDKVEFISPDKGLF